MIYEKTSNGTLTTSGTSIQARSYKSELTYSSAEGFKLDTSAADALMIKIEVSKGSFVASTPASRRRDEIAQINKKLRNLTK
jgi:hypothetical protein